MTEKVFKVIDDAGIHARPATIIVNTANKFESVIHIHYKERSANLKSLLGVMALGIQKGSEVKISAKGHDAETALLTLQETMQNGGIAI